MKFGWYKEMSPVISSNFLWLPSTRVLCFFPSGINSTTNSDVSIASDIINILHLWASKCNLLKILFSFAAGLLYPTLDLLFLLWLTCLQVRCLLGVASYFPAQLFSLTGTVSFLPACFFPGRFRKEGLIGVTKQAVWNPATRIPMGAAFEVWGCILVLCLCGLGTFKFSL